MMIYKYVFVKRSIVCQAIEKSKSKFIQVKNHGIEKILTIHNNVYTMIQVSLSYLNLIIFLKNVCTLVVLVVIYLIYISF